MANKNEEKLKDYIKIKMLEEIVSIRNIGKDREEDIEKLNNAVDKIYKDCKGASKEVYALGNKIFYDYYLCEWIA